MYNTSDLISQQVPDHIRSDYPNFVLFLQEYYNFLDQFNVDIEKTRDIDTILSNDVLFKFLKNEIAKHFPAAIIDNDKLYWSIRQIYRTKGTVNSIDLLFRIFFNDSIVVYQPGNDILRVSDGRWQIEKSIIIKKRYGNFDPEENNVFVIENQFGNFFIEPIRIEQLDDVRYKIFFFNITNIVLDYEAPTQLVRVYDGDTEIYQGELVKGPSSLRVLTPGKYWKLGQTLRIEGTPTDSGTVKDTIAKVEEIGPNGELVRVSIFDYGFEHGEGELIQLSSLPYKPLLDNSSVFSELLGYNGTVPFFHHHVSIDDETSGFNENVIGTSDTQYTFNNYFLEDYNYNSGDGFYNGVTVINQKQIFTIPETIQDSGITNEEYYESLTVLLYEYSYITEYPGQYISDSSLLSNNFIRLQDNFFYQLFSYVIESTLNNDIYKPTLDLIHPAGLKYFSVLAKTGIVISNYSASSVVTLQKQFLYESIDDIPDYIAKFFEKFLIDPLELGDLLEKVVTKSFISDIEVTSNSILELAKIFNTDTINIQDANNATITYLPSFDLDVYFAEDYAIEETVLTLN